MPRKPKWTEAQMGAAVFAAQNGMSVRKAAKKHKVPAGTLGSRIARARAATGSKQVFANVSVFANSGDDTDVDPDEIRQPDRRLTPKQWAFLWLIIPGLLTITEAARRVGIHRDTAHTWLKNPVFVAVRNEMEQEIHGSTASALKEIVRCGVLAQVEVIEVLREIATDDIPVVKIRGRDDLVLDPSAQIQASRTIASTLRGLLPHAGHPKTERHEHSGGISVGAESLLDTARTANVNDRDEMREALRDEASEIRLIWDADAAEQVDKERETG